jgi:hypothetical protein
MLEQGGFELSALIRLLIAKFPANLAIDSEVIKAAELQRALSPCIREEIRLWSLATNPSAVQRSQRRTKRKAI